MALHLYEVGEQVSLASAMRAAALSADVFTVMARLPHLGVRLQYRVKTAGEPYERVVTEEQLTRLAERDELRVAV